MRVLEVDSVTDESDDGTDGVSCGRSAHALSVSRLQQGRGRRRVARAVIDLDGGDECDQRQKPEGPRGLYLQLQAGHAHDERC